MLLFVQLQKDKKCNVSGTVVPCPYCVASSPLDHERCAECAHKEWKEQKYIEQSGGKM